MYSSVDEIIVHTVIIEAEDETEARDEALEKDKTEYEKTDCLLSDVEKIEELIIS